MKPSSENKKFISSNINSKQYYNKLNNISNTLRQNNNEISSIILASKSQGYFTSRNFHKFSYKNEKETPKNKLSEDAKLLLSKEKLSEDRNKKIAALTFRQDISHILNSGPKNFPSYQNKEDFFKNRNFSLPFVVPSKGIDQIKGLSVATEYLSPRDKKENTKTKLSSPKAEIHLSIEKSPSPGKKDHVDISMLKMKTPPNRLEIILLNEWLEKAIHNLSLQEKNFNDDDFKWEIMGIV